jgi:hypothetical protein
MHPAPHASLPAAAAVAAARPASAHAAAGRVAGAGAAGALVVLLAAACATEAGGDGGPALDPATAEVAYQFHDSSVPPEYHRSYTITVQRGEARMVVDSYGDVLHDVTEDVDDETWAEVLDRVGALRVSGRVGSDDCTGGTASELQAQDATHTPGDGAVAVFAAPCGGEGSGAAEAIDTAIEPVVDLFDTEELLATD